jgi:hypothetical protein
MSREERHLETKIRLSEDMMIRCKNSNEIDDIRKEVYKMRKQLQQMRFDRLSRFASIR